MADSRKESAFFDGLDHGGRNLLFGCRLLKQLSSLGVEHIVISPGSRSTPLTLAGARLNEHGLLKTHVILDERSAAFFALGIGKSTGKPAVLICTSGTAVANYYPAVIEARMTSTPLIVISADRPAALQQMMAPQTINQTHIFNDYPVLFVQAEDVVETDSSGEQTCRLARQIMQDSLRKAGPVHLNAGFSKPLEPNQQSADLIIKHVLASGLKAGNVAQSPDTLVQDDDGLRALIEKLQQASRPLVIAGPLNVSSTAERELLSYTLRTSDVPHILEGSSGMQKSAGNGNLILGYESFLRNPDKVEQLRPDFILRIGPPAVSKALNEFFKAIHNVPQWCFSSSEHIPDPVKTSERFIQWTPFTPLKFTSDKYQPNSDTHQNCSEWLHKWRIESDSIVKAINKLDAPISNNPALSDGQLIRSVLKVLQKNDAPEYQLFVSNSFSVRDIDLFNAQPLTFPAVYHNRGGSGIDGITSTAAGTAVGSGKPVWLIVGELSFLHDTNALLQLARYKGPKIRILILNNSGGTIFRMLPVSSHSGQYQTYFETPQQADLQKLCAAYGVNSMRVDNASNLNEMLTDAALADDHVLIIEAVTDTDSSMQERLSLWKNG
ncbi:MAG: 2-succinyl-5-enolpyruvyl-6-hydroxy-3-cyclohexene-1-carboxylic-acid synthase [Balneolia bacterium]|nr:2-succinyl-5-enolpyruvyl-6-hydroxy-3-cyclohexene-1-carboxylic-acid synthase [Balneolia bacterium]